MPRIREGAGGGASHTEGIDKGGKPLGLRTPASNEKLGGFGRQVRPERIPESKWKEMREEKEPSGKLMPTSVNP